MQNAVISGLVHGNPGCNHRPAYQPYAEIPKKARCTAFMDDSADLAGFLECAELSAGTHQENGANPAFISGFSGEKDEFGAIAGSTRRLFD